MVLCAYLGQLVKLRKALSTEVATLVDERDAVQLINYEADEDVGAILDENAAQKVKVSTRVYVFTMTSSRLSTYIDTTNLVSCVLSTISKVC